MNKYRKLIIYTNPTKYSSLNQIIMNKKIKDAMEDRNLKIDIIKRDDDKMELYGYDKLLKYDTDQISVEEFTKIFEAIDKMPMRGGDQNLYTDNNPETTLKGTGYKDEKKARETIKLIEKRSIIYQKALINTMYNRAKYNKNKTVDMEKAMKVFKTWLNENKDKKQKYDYLDLDIVKKYEKLAEEYDISHVARGIKKPTKTDEGFLVIYKKYKGKKSKLPFIPVFKDKHAGQDYDSYRESFLNSRLGQMKHAKTKLYNDDGLPTKQHIILIMHAYSPDPKGIKKLISK